MVEQSKRRSRRQPSKKSQALKMLLSPWGVAILMVIVIAALWWRNRPMYVAFDPSTPAGEAALDSVQTFPDQGQAHVNPGQSVDYDSDFPTSGPHDPVPVMPGVYTEAQPPEQLVHSIEHGNIVIYYEQPGDEAYQTLQSWARQFPGAWDGLVVVPKAGLGESIVLTAWTKKLVMPEFEAQAAASFIDAYRGRGPENPVR
ncbi:MAG: DUF3105 domain-containing protein [Kaiparowitsia implicata GSE-PSE-MK54-09C]|jgi:hypothetical protein|nr:DUF3105 domain-containing protein [Kaiparowitsia implicata GSE-PSE-MK54-09C]